MNLFIYLFLLVSLDIFKHKSRERSEINPVSVTNSDFQHFAFSFPGWGGDVGAFHSKSQALYRSVEDFSFCVTCPREFTFGTENHFLLNSSIKYV